MEPGKENKEGDHQSVMGTTEEGMRIDIDFNYWHSGDEDDEADKITVSTNDRLALAKLTIEDFLEIVKGCCVKIVDNEDHYYCTH